MAATANREVAPPIAQYHRLKLTDPDAYDFSLTELNRVGYWLLRNGRTKDAVEIFKLNTEAFPDSWLAHDSLADGYANDGQKALGIEHYRKSLQLNPAQSSGERGALQQLIGKAHDPAR